MTNTDLGLRASSAACRAFTCSERLFGSKAVGLLPSNAALGLSACARACGRGGGRAGGLGGCSCNESCTDGSNTDGPGIICRVTRMSLGPGDSVSCGGGFSGGLSTDSPGDSVSLGSSTSCASASSRGLAVEPDPIVVGTLLAIRPLGALDVDIAVALESGDQAIDRAGCA